MRPRMPLPSAWRRESLRTNLWLVPTVEIALAVALFAGTYALDRAAYDGSWQLPSFFISGTADAARQILTATAAAVITVVTLVFSITIVTLTLASTQFGPRMLRNFIRDRITQDTLGSIVATIVHGARSVQLPQVIASIAGDLSRSIEAEAGPPRYEGPKTGPSLSEMLVRLDEDSGLVTAPSSGYLQYVSISTLVDISTRGNAVIRLLHRPGHFVVEGNPLAQVWPAEAAPGVARALGGAHATGPHRTLTQDVSFAVDQLVEIAIRALSPAVNDTFTALACIDWLGDGLCKIASQWQPTPVHRDAVGHVRVIAVTVGFPRLLERSHDKIRQASRGMPAVMIRQLDGLTKLMAYTTSAEQHQLVLEQAAMILRASEESVAEEADRADVRRRYEVVGSAGSSRTNGGFPGQTQG